MRARQMAGLALCVSLLAAPLTAAHASEGGGAPHSRVGVLLAVMCGLSLRAAIPAPVPWAGVAVMSCLFGFLDAAMSPDSPDHPDAAPAPAHP